MQRAFAVSSFFFFNGTAPTEIYTLSLHDALPISRERPRGSCGAFRSRFRGPRHRDRNAPRSEEYTSELQSQSNLVCRLLLEKKKKKKHNTNYIRILSQQYGDYRGVYEIDKKP